MAESRSEKLRVAIVGGGCGALTAAYELSKNSNCEITVYQMGWRLGGKGASGRNAENNNRTEEHGLHVWMGWYENSFRLMREVYDELGRLYAPSTVEQARSGAAPAAQRKKNAHERPASRFTHWREAFVEDPWIGVADRSRGEWRVWASHLPAMPGLPGDPFAPDTNPFSLSGYLARAVDLVRALIHSTFFATEEPREPDRRELLEFSRVSPRAIVDRLAELVRGGALLSASALYEAMSILGVIVSGRFSLPAGDYKVLQFAEAIADNVRRQAEALLTLDDEARPKLELVELVVTVIVGILRDGLLSDPQGLDAINDEDCRAWLRRHGASKRASESSLVRALYDMAFANVALDDDDAPGLAAGQALRGALRMFFTYRGALFWKMRAGMGDAVFSPLYEVLKLRGVKFKFFHRLREVKLDATGELVSELIFDVQAEPRGKQPVDGSRLGRQAAKDDEYYPLDADGCWPSRPFWDRLDVPRKVSDAADFERGAANPRPRAKTLTLSVQDGFDFVVLGASVSALEPTCAALGEKDSRWQAMFEHVRTTTTHSLQLWLREGVETLGPLPTPITVAGFRQPFDTLADMTQILAEEEEAKDPALGLLYLCGAYDERDPALQPRDARDARSPRERALDRVIAYLERQLPRLLPGCRDEQTGGFRWSLLVGGGNETSALTQEQKRKLLEKHHYTINSNPSDRYVLSRPSSLQYRISPLYDRFANLTIAGDWTDCGFNEGCVEAAVMSGMLAAHALTGYPALEDIVGYDHP